MVWGGLAAGMFTVLSATTHEFRQVIPGGGLPHSTARRIDPTGQPRVGFHNRPLMLNFAQPSFSVSGPRFSFPPSPLGQDL